MPKDGDLPPDLFEEVFTRTIRLKGGRVLFSSAYGLKAFRIKVRKRSSSDVRSDGEKDV